MKSLPDKLKMRPSAAFLQRAFDGLPLDVMTGVERLPEVLPYLDHKAAVAANLIISTQEARESLGGRSRPEPGPEVRASIEDLGSRLVWRWSQDIDDITTRLAEAFNARDPAGRAMRILVLPKGNSRRMLGAKLIDLGDVGIEVVEDGTASYKSLMSED